MYLIIVRIIFFVFILILLLLTVGGSSFSFECWITAHAVITNSALRLKLVDVLKS